MTNRYSILIKKSEDDWLTWLYFTEASKALSGAAFKVYIYLYAGGSDDIIYYSPKRLQDDMGISNSSAHRAFNELVTNHYLTATKKENFYIFTPMQVKQF